MNQSLKGKEYQQVSFTVDRDRVLQFADAIGEDNPVFRDAEAARSTYFRLRKRLAEQGRLTFEVAEPITLRRNRPPGAPSELELRSAAAMTNLPPGDTQDRRHLFAWAQRAPGDRSGDRG